MPSRFPLADSAGLVLDELADLFRSEVRLLKAELRQGLNNLKAGLMLVAAAALLSLLAVGQLLDAAAAALVERGFGPAAASGIVGGSVLLLAAILAWLGSRRLTAKALAPERSLEALRATPAEAKDSAR